MDSGEIAKLIVVVTTSLVVLAPVLAITVRLALKPVVEAMIRLREGGSAAESMRLLEQRMALLSDEVQEVRALREDVHRLIEAQEFQLRLTAPTPGVRERP
jgi:hypothetical protein